MKRIATTVALLALAACGASDAPPDGNRVRVVRDDYGVPHIYADDLYGLYYGYGYAIAEDRLFQMEMARRSTQGTVAEVLGSDYVEYDRNTRTLFDPASIRRQLEGLAPRDRDVFDGYAAGMNAWLAEMRGTPEALTPTQFIDLGFLPEDWDAYDVAMIFIGTMNNRYGDFNTELENSAILHTLTELHGEAAASELFDLLNPRFTDNAPTTIPRRDWSRQAADVLDAAAAIDAPTPGAMAASAAISGMSNVYLLGRDKVAGAGSILVNGPQFGWFNPSYVYSVGMHGAGIDVVGNSPFGYPMVMFGHNATIAWGSTWGASDIVDIYAERLADDDPGRYLYKGEYVAFTHRTERIAVKDSDDVEHDVYRSVHGPIIRVEPDTGLAYAKHRAWDGRELETLLAWLYATWAHDFASWKAQAEKSALNVNMYYADVDGNIGYFHGGRFPRRVAGHDNRFPASGDGSMDWQGRQAVDVANPHVENPASGYLANWNNKPGHGAMNPDFFFYSWSTADRVDILHEALSSKDEFTPDEAWALLEPSSYADVNAPYLLPVIDAAVRSAGDPALDEANAILKAWNRQSRDADGDGFYDEAATAIFRTFLGALIHEVLADDLGAALPHFAATGYPTADTPTGAGTNIQVAVKAIVEALEGQARFDVFNGEAAAEVVAAALRDTVEELAAGGVALEALRLPVATRPFLTRNFLGVPQAGDDELLVAPIEQNRGTENNMIVMRPNAIEGYEVTPPGQSGFVAPDGTRGAHYDDQLELYYSFGRKRTWFYADDVEAHATSETVLTY